MDEKSKYAELTEVKALLEQIPGALNILLKYNIVSVIEKPLIGSQVIRLTDNVNRELNKLK